MSGDESNAIVDAARRREPDDRARRQGTGVPDRVRRQPVARHRRPRRRRRRRDAHRRRRRASIDLVVDRRPGRRAGARGRGARARRDEAAGLRGADPGARSAVSRRRRCRDRARFAPGAVVARRTCCRRRSARRWRGRRRAGERSTGGRSGVRHPLRSGDGVAPSLQVVDAAVAPTTSRRAVRPHEAQHASDDVAPAVPALAGRGATGRAAALGPLPAVAARQRRAGRTAARTERCRPRRWPPRDARPPPDVVELITERMCSMRCRCRCSAPDGTIRARRACRRWSCTGRTARSRWWSSRPASPQRGRRAPAGRVSWLDFVQLAPGSIVRRRNISACD